jgi:hypothetical protein
VEGEDRQLDVVVAEDGGGGAPADRSIRVIGEAKAGERLSERHLRRLERARAALGTRAAQARLLLFGAEVGDDLRALADGRADVELVDLERLYGGS